jgi:hypothetical protein
MPGLNCDALRRAANERADWSKFHVMAKDAELVCRHAARLLMGAARSWPASAAGRLNCLWGDLLFLQGRFKCGDGVRQSERAVDEITLRV